MCCCAGYLFRPFFKKRGGGKGDWGLPGDEMVEAPVDPRDPSCESDWSDAELEEALREHLQPRADEARSPTSQDDYVMVYAATPDDAGAAVTVDCDKPAAAALSAHGYASCLRMLAPMLRACLACMRACLACTSGTRRR